jgi:hypothetical protein
MRDRFTLWKVGGVEHAEKSEHLIN